MENQFNKIMSQKSNEELIKITTILQDQYQPLAIDAALNELEKRNISDSEIEEITQIVTKEESQETKKAKSMAGSGLRFLNWIIDSFVWLCMAFILTLPFSTKITWQKMLCYIIIFTSYILYYYLLETKYQKTLGKFITKTKVVKNSEERPSKSDIIVRTLLRIIPFFDSASYLFIRNGLHDRLSETKVIKDIK